MSTSNIFSNVYIYGNCTVKGTFTSLGGSAVSQWTTSGSAIYYSTGNVGIGTATPGYTFNVNGGAIGVTGASNYLYYAVTNSTSSGAYMLFDAATVGGSGRKYQIGSTGTGNNPGTGCFELYDLTAGATRLVVNSSGYIGIGTTNPGSTLTVSGTVGIGSGYQAFTAPTNGLIVQGGVGIGTSNPGVNALQVSGNVVTSGFTSNATNTIFNFDTLTVPFVSATQVLASTLGTSVTGTALQVSGNLYATDTIASANPMMFRNRLYNGAMNIWQRTTAATATAASAYSTADRWCGALGTTNLTLSQSATVPSGSGFQNSLQVATTTATASTPLIEQRIEYVNIPDLLNTVNVTVSFWASQTSGTLMPLVIGLYYASAVNNFGTQTLAVSATQSTPTLTATLTYYTLTFALTTSTCATNGMSLRFTTGATASAGTFLVTGIQLEKGSTASPFEFRPYQSELALCQRYYYQITSPTPGSTGVAAQVYAYFATATGISTTAFWFPIVFPVPMRYPSFTVTNSAASNWQIYNGTSSISATALSTQTDSYTVNGLAMNCTVASGATAGNSYIFRTAGLTGSTTAYIGISCEV